MPATINVRPDGSKLSHKFDGEAEKERRGFMNFGTCISNTHLTKIRSTATILLTHSNLLKFMSGNFGLKFPTCLFQQNKTKAWEF